MTEAATPRATAREWIGLGVIALPCLLYAMDLTVLNLAVPALSVALEPSSTQLLWILDIYGFMVAGFLIPMGNLGDRIGRRLLLLAGAAFFAVASVLAAFSDSADMLVGTRALLGLAGATVAPSTLSLIRNMFHDPTERTTAIGIWIASFSIGGAIGPVVGGVLIEFFWWGSVFLLAVPVMLLVLVLGPLLLPEYRDPGARPLDLTSAALSLAAVLAAIFGVKVVATGGQAAVALPAIAAGLALGILFVRRQRRLADPLLDLELLRAPQFAPALAIYVLGGVVMFGIYYFIAQYLQLVVGLSPLDAGLWMLPTALGFVAGSLLTSRAAARFSREPLIVGGFAVTAAAFAAMALVEGGDGLVLLIVTVGVTSLALAPVFTLANDLIVGMAPPARAGAAAGLSETCAEFAGAVGIALFGTMGTVLYRADLAANLPAGLPAAAETALATLGAALELAARLPDPLGSELAQAARGAFVEGLQATAIICALITSATALLARRLFRTRAP
jgi:DHA2 family multidrug resistance protein-like MFS transporter